MDGFFYVTNASRQAGGSKKRTALHSILRCRVFERAAQAFARSTFAAGPHKRAQEMKDCFVVLTSRPQKFQSKGIASLAFPDGEPRRAQVHVFVLAYVEELLALNKDKNRCARLRPARNEKCRCQSKLRLLGRCCQQSLTGAYVVLVSLGISLCGGWLSCPHTDKAILFALMAVLGYVMG